MCALTGCCVARERRADIGGGAGEIKHAKGVTRGPIARVTCAWVVVGTFNRCCLTETVGHVARSGMAWVSRGAVDILKHAQWLAVGVKDTHVGGAWVVVIARVHRFYTVTISAFHRHACVDSDALGLEITSTI